MGKNGKFILAKNITTSNQLPIIFGNFEILDFLKLLKKSFNSSYTLLLKGELEQVLAVKVLMLLLSIFNFSSC